MENAQRQGMSYHSAAVDLALWARLTLLVCLVFFSIGGYAQATPRDYAISPPRVSYTPDRSAAVVSISVTNQGGDARNPARIVVSEYQSGRVETIEPLPPLAADQTQEFSIQLPLGHLRGDGIISFKIEAGIDEFELANSPIARDNSQLFHIDRSDARGSSGDVSSSESTIPADARFGLHIPIVNLSIIFLEDGILLNESRYSSGDMLLALGLLTLALISLWLLSLILRLVFRRPPRFDVWQPPYAASNWQDPNSAEGRRQSWQFHAQNSSLGAPSAPDQLTVVKRLLDRRGVVLGGWRIKAMRTVQYDVYGRINRTEAVMPGKIISQLNSLARRAPRTANQELQKAIAPIAKRLSKQALGRVEKQNLMLPLALDIRFEGIAGEVRIQFELYHFRDSAWHLIDQWAPELGQPGDNVPEQFTFTLNGQLSGESKKEFKRRLPEEIAQLLAGLFYHHQAEVGAVPPTNEISNAEDFRKPRDAAWDGTPLDDETDPSALPLS
ncbi:MAG: hypothetical protein OXG84_17795 [Chloroflexi bacterium]|nr:hypothetical protein [Chloroflexota bacterium]